MPYIIVTSRNLIWLLTSILALLLMFTSLVSPAWLVAPDEQMTMDNKTVSYNPSVGVFTKCNRMRDQFFCSTIAISGLATESYVFPIYWKASLVLIAFGLSVMVVAVFLGLTSCCVQVIFKKSLASLAGVGQSVVGMFYILGIMLHPMAWGSPRVQRLCGPDASPFYPDNCSLGIGLWLAVAATILTFASAVLSVFADKSTDSDKVQDEIMDGHTLICVA